MNTYTCLKEQKKKLEIIINRHPINEKQREAIEDARRHLVEVNKMLETLETR